MIQRGCILTEDELIKALDSSEKTIRNWCKDGLTFRRPGGYKRLFVTDEVIDFLKARPKLTKETRNPTMPK